MSSGLLYHGLGIRGYRLVRTRFEFGAMILVIELPPEKRCCPDCGSRNVHSRGTTWRLFRGMPIGRKPVFLELAVPRLFCWSCHAMRQPALRFADPKKRHTRSFARYVLDLSQFMTLTDVARHLGISWDTVKEIQRQRLMSRYSKPKLKHLKQLAIDEISIGKGHRYVTVVLDLESGAIVFVGRGKGADSLAPFWKRLRASRAKIQAVATDLSSAYILAVRENLPQATHVFDRFHVMKLLNEQLSELRRELYHEATTKLEKDVLKGTRWLLLKNPEHLDDTRQESRRLQDALDLNASLAAAYYLKDDLRQFWQQPNRVAADVFLDRWCARAEATGIRRLERFAKTLQTHRQGLLDWYLYPISTGPLEGTNTKIRVLQRQAYGYRDQTFFQLKLYALHEAKHALVG